MFQNRLIRIFAGLTFCLLGRFTAAQEYVYGAASFPAELGQVVITADFNADGSPDIAILSTSALTNSTVVSVLLGTPAGYLAPKVDYPVGQFFGATGLAVGDVNGDGKLDLIVAAGTVYILPGNGDGTFQTVIDLSVSNTGAYSVAVGDFNRDGKLDLAVAANAGDPAGAVLLGRGDGTFQTPIPMNIGGIFSGDGGPSIISGDVNGDGIPDLVIGSAYEVPGTISVLLGVGDGTFQPYVSYSIPGNGGVSLALADMNADGLLDIVAASFYGNSTGVSVLLGTGGGRFATAISNSTYDFVSSIAVGDFDGDGKLDVAAIGDSSSTGENTVIVFPGKGDGTLGEGVEWGGGPGPTTLALGDFNHDGRVDIVTSGSNLVLTSYVATVLIGQGNGKFASQAMYPAAAYPYDIAAGDFNGDGHLDVVTTTFSNPGAISIALSDGNGGFKSPVSIPVGHYPAYVSVADFNHDGKEDIVFSDNGADGQTPRLGVLLGNGDGTFAAPIYRSVAFVQNKFALADFNKDNNLDIALSDNLGNVVSVYLGQGDGTFADPTSYPTLPYPTYLFAADVNNDGAPDLVVSTQSDATSVLLNKGDGTFQPYQNVTPSVVARVGDFNNDGMQDLLIDGVPPTVLLGNGDGTFRNPPLSGSRLSSSQAQHPDFNGDGNADYARVGSDGLTLFLGNGDGTFGERIDYNAPNSPWSSVVGDFTGRGGDDIVVAAATGASGGTLMLFSNVPVISVFPTSLAFPSQLVGASTETQSISLSNRGGVALTLSNILSSTGFAQQNDCGSTVLPGQSCSLSVSAKPASAGALTGALTLYHNAAGGSQVIPLTASGRDFAIAASPNSVTISAGQTGSYTLNVTPEGGSTDTVSLTCSGAPAKATCSITPTSATLDGTHPSTVAVSVGTTASTASSVLFLPRSQYPFVASVILVFIVFLSNNFGRICRSRVGERPCRILLPCILLMLASSCGGGNTGSVINPPSNPGTPSGTYKLTINAQASAGGATLIRTTTITLTVQ